MVKYRLMELNSEELRTALNGREGRWIWYGGGMETEIPTMCLTPRIDI